MFDVYISLRVIHPPSGRHPGPATETRWASNPQVSQQEPGGCRRYQTFLQPHRKTQHCAGALCGHRSVNTQSFVSGGNIMLLSHVLGVHQRVSGCLWLVECSIILTANPLPPSPLPDNKSFFVLSMSDNGAQIYELMAPTVSDQRTWDKIRFDWLIKSMNFCFAPRELMIFHFPLHKGGSVLSPRGRMPWKSNLTASYHYLRPSMLLCHRYLMWWFSVLGLVTDLACFFCPSGERDGVEIITAGVSRLIRDPDRTSTGSTQSTGNLHHSFL